MLAPLRHRALATQVHSQSGLFLSCGFSFCTSWQGMLIPFRVLSHWRSSEHHTCSNIFRICTHSPFRFSKEKGTEQGLYVIKTTSQGHTVTGLVLVKLVTHIFETFWTAQNWATNCIWEFPFESQIRRYLNTSTHKKCVGTRTFLPISPWYRKEYCFVWGLRGFGQLSVQ